MTKTTTRYGKTFEIIDSKTVEDGDFSGRNILFTEDVLVKGDLKTARYIAEKSISIEGSDVTEYWQEVGEYQEVGGWQKVGEWQKVEQGIVIGLYSKIGGKSHIGFRIFVGTCPWREISDDEKTYTTKKLVKGEMAYGILNETG